VHRVNIIRLDKRFFKVKFVKMNDMVLVLKKDASKKEMEQINRKLSRMPSCKGPLSYPKATKR